MAHMSFTHLQYAIPTDTTSYNQDEVSRLCSEVDALRGELKRLRESDTTQNSGSKRVRVDEVRLLLTEVGMQRMVNVHYRLFEKNHGTEIPMSILRLMQQTLHRVLDEVLESGLGVLEIMNGVLTEVALEHTMRNAC